MNVLVTGPSGSGKSTLGRSLRARGCNVVEADVDTYDGRSIAYFRSRLTGRGVDAPSWPLPAGWTDEHEWVWRPDVIRRQLDEWPGQRNVVCGDARNKSAAFPLFDRIFFLAVDDDTLRRRILGREDHDFGKDPEQLAWILEENRNLRDEARRAGGVLLEASRPPDELADDLLARLARADGMSDDV